MTSTRLLTLASLVLLGAVLTAGAGRSRATAADEAAVRAALQHYLEGHATGQADHFREAMNPEGMMYYVRDGKLTQMTLADYIARAAAGDGKPAADEARRKRRIEFVDITGAAAVAKIVLEYPDVILTDYMELLRVDGKWQIVAKSFDANRAK